MKIRCRVFADIQRGQRLCHQRRYLWNNKRIKKAPSFSQPVDPVQTRGSLLKIIVVSTVVGAVVCGAIWYRQRLVFPSDLNQLVADLEYLIKKKPEIIPQILRLIFLQNENHTQTHSGRVGPAGTASLRLENVRALAKHSDTEEVIKLLNKVRDCHNNVGLMDIWTLASCVAIEQAGGPEMVSLWRFGRIDSNPFSSYAYDRGPSPSSNGEGGCLQTMAVFARMGLPLEDMVCLMGAHTLGRKHIKISGFDGPWTSDEKIFSNSYYKLLLSETWEASDGSSLFDKTKHNYQYISKSKKHTMLPVDVCLIQNERTLKIVRKYAADEQAWKDDFRRVWTRFCDLNMEWLLYKPAAIEDYPSILAMLPIGLYLIGNEMYSREFIREMRSLDKSSNDTIEYIKSRFREIEEA